MDNAHGDEGSAREFETEEQTLTRNWTELLQELRVTQTGVQVLTGFLLTVPFSNRFTELDQLQRVTYLVVLTGAVLTTALILAPVAFHRILFRRHRRGWLVEMAHQMARVGLACVALTTCGVAFLVFDLVLGTPAAVIAGVVALAVFLGLWLALPLRLQREESPTR